MVNRQADNLDRLALVAGLKRDAESQELARLNAEIRAQQSQLARLRKILHRRNRGLELDPARLSGADVHWVRNTERQIAALMARVTALNQQRDTLLRAAALATGRAQVIETLARKARAPRRGWE